MEQPEDRAAVDDRGGWVQAELEYAKQLGYGGGCGSPPCTIWLKMSGGSIQVSTDNCATWAAGVAPFSEGPALPVPDFPEGRVVITTDPDTTQNPDFYQMPDILQSMPGPVSLVATFNTTMPVVVWQWRELTN